MLSLYKAYDWGFMMLKTISLILLFFCHTVWATKHIDTVEIQYQDAKEVINALTPVLSEGESVSASGQVLIIKAEKVRLDELKRIITQIDKKPQGLMVTISYGRQKPSTEISVERTETFYSTSPANRQIYQTSRERDERIHQLRMNSGEVAFIENGVTVPLLLDLSSYSRQAQAGANFQANRQALEQRLGVEVPTTNPVTINNPENIDEGGLVLSSPPTTSSNGAIVQLTPTPGGDAEVELSISQQSDNSTFNRGFEANEQASSFGLDYVDLKSGVYLKPRLVNKRVVLNVMTVNQQPNKNQLNQSLQSSAFNTNRMETTVDIEVGQWTYLGGNEIDTQQTYPNRLTTKKRELERQSIWVKVELMP